MNNDFKIQNKPFNFALPDIDPALRLIEQTEQQMVREKQEKAEYDAAVLENLKAIRENTNDLKLITDLLRVSVKNSEEMLKMYSEMHEIATAKSLEEVESKYRKFMKSVDNLKTDIENTVAIREYALMIYKTTVEVIKLHFGG